MSFDFRLIYEKEVSITRKKYHDDIMISCIRYDTVSRYLNPADVSVFVIKYMSIESILSMLGKKL